MRILLVSNLFPPEVIGGYELVAQELALCLAGAGHDVTVATSPLINHSKENSGSAVAVHRVLNYTGLSLDGTDPHKEQFKSGIIQLCNISALRVLIEQFSPDQILLCNISGLGALGIVTFLHEVGFHPAIYLGDNVFSACSNPHLRGDFFQLFGARKALQALRPIAVSRLVVEEVQQTLGQSLDRPLFVPGWVSNKLTPLCVDPTEDVLRLVFSSRIATHKGIWILVDAVKHLLSCGDDGFIVDVYGAGSTPEFKQRVHALGLSSHIRYQGMLGRENMIHAFSRYEALLFPTWEREPLGLVPFEAAAQGCLPILTAQTGAAEWFTATDCIKIERSAEGLAGAIQFLMAMPQEERVAWRTSTAARIRSSFSAEQWMPRIERFLSQLPSRRHRLAPLNVQNALFAITRMWRD
ncbi:glycosyltransferase family 4 protein [Paraburkholderia sp. A2RI-6]|uniref:glycosyltransferase family 4 protein n=1 Tax=Paraburkholderia sp. A2RI-6 TaxID=3028371 RepID=UPI003B799BC8